MRERVLAVVNTLGYEPDMLAQSLRRGESLSIGFVVRDISDPEYAEMVMAAEETLRADGYSLLLANSGNDPERDVRHIRLLKQRRVDGLLLSHSDELHEETVEQLAQLRVPYVLVDRQSANHGDAALSDHRQGIEATVNTLAELGHRRIAFIGGSPTVRPSYVRASAVKEACARHEGMEAVIESGAFTAEHGRAAALRVLSLSPRPTAVIAGGNQILVGVLRAIRECSIAIPEELSLVTCDNIMLSEFIDPALATIERSASTLGAEAAIILLRLLRGEPGGTTLLPVSFVRRGSCGLAPLILSAEAMMQR
jgi:LacI family transcriptional regulator